jgi:hypothetical protein
MRQKKKKNLPSIHVETAIRTLRDERVILDTDLANIYGIPTYRLNEAVKRNREGFPEDFMYQLNQEEQAALTSQIAMSKRGRGGRRPLRFHRAWCSHGCKHLEQLSRSSDEYFCGPRIHQDAPDYGSEQCARRKAAGVGK